jgi:hypothetical protein
VRKEARVKTFAEFRFAAALGLALAMISVSAFGDA